MLECHKNIRPVLIKRRRPDGRIITEKANPITPIVNLSSGHVHFVRLGPIDQHVGGFTLAHYHQRRVNISPPYVESHAFYEELCRRGMPELGIERSPTHWARFRVLREAIYRGDKPDNLGEDFWHPYVAECKARKSSQPVADIAKLVAALEDEGHVVPIDVDEDDDA